MVTDEGLAFGVLGPLQMRVGGTEVLLGTPKQRAVLAMLVINRNRPVGIESLLNAAWEQWPPPGAGQPAFVHIESAQTDRCRGSYCVGQRATGLPTECPRN